MIMSKRMARYRRKIMRRVLELILVSSDLIHRLSVFDMAVLCVVLLIGAESILSYPLNAFTKFICNIMRLTYMWILLVSVPQLHRILTDWARTRLELCLNSELQ